MFMGRSLCTSQVLEQNIITSKITGKLLVDLNEDDSSGYISNVLQNSNFVIMQLRNNESTDHLSGWWVALMHLVGHLQMPGR